VREGEREPPPHSNVLILLDTHFDAMLYTPETGRLGTDLLCEYALACALELSAGGIDARVAWTGLCETAADSEENRQGGAFGGNPAFLHGGTPAEIAAIFARPAAIRWVVRETGKRSSAGVAVNTARLPAPPADCGIVVFALPRATAESSELNRFLDRISGDGIRSAEVIFLYKGSGRDGAMDEAAEVCGSFYRRRQGIRVRLMKVD
jgi:hypothetical protein